MHRCTCRIYIVQCSHDPQAQRENQSQTPPSAAKSWILALQSARMRDPTSPLIYHSKLKDTATHAHVQRSAQVTSPKLCSKVVVHQRGIASNHMNDQVLPCNCIPQSVASPRNSTQPFIRHALIGLSCSCNCSNMGRKGLPGICESIASAVARTSRASS